MAEERCDFTAVDVQRPQIGGTITLPAGQTGTDALQPRGSDKTFVLRSERPKDIKEIFAQGLLRDGSDFVDRVILVHAQADRKHDQSDSPHLPARLWPRRPRTFAFLCRH